MSGEKMEKKKIRLKMRMDYFACPKSWMKLMILKPQKPLYIHIRTPVSSEFKTTTAKNISSNIGNCGHSVRFMQCIADVNDEIEEMNGYFRGKLAE